jgi:hypothetical protein
MIRKGRKMSGGGVVESTGEEKTVFPIHVKFETEEK